MHGREQGPDRSWGRPGLTFPPRSDGDGPRRERLGEQRDESLELDVRRGGDLLVRAVQRPGGQAGLAVDQLGDPGVERVRCDDPPRGDRLVLPDAVDPVDGLGLLGVAPSAAPATVSGPLASTAVATTAGTRR